MGPNLRELRQHVGCRDLLGASGWFIVCSEGYTRTPKQDGQLLLKREVVNVHQQAGTPLSQESLAREGECLT